MKSLLAKIAAGTLLFGGASLAPVIPGEDMRLELSYQIPYADQFTLPTYDRFGNPIEPRPTFDDTDGDGIVSASVFINSKGERVYVQIDETRYKDMGKKGGIAHNPKKQEMLTVWEAMQPKKAQAAIALDTSTKAVTAGATSLTYAHTVTGTDTMVVVGSTVVHAADEQDITSMTYNGEAMTEAVRVYFPTNSANNSLYYAVGADTGSNNVVINVDATYAIGAMSISYTGVKQSGQPDASSIVTETAVVANVTANVTTVADNSWVIFMHDNSSNFFTGSYSNATGRQAFTTTVCCGAIADSATPVTPAGSFSQTGNSGSGNAAFTALQVSFAPAVVAPSGGGVTEDDWLLLF